MLDEENKTETPASPVDQNPTPPIQPETSQSFNSNSSSTPSVKKSEGKSPGSRTRGKWLLAILAGIILIALAGIGGYLIKGKTATPTPVAVASPTPEDQGGQVACTMDAKQCPDGSYVSRQGPKCEFAACPTGTASSSAVKYLEIPAFGVKIPLIEANKDAYAVVKTVNGLTFAELKVHSLDSEKYCTDGLVSLNKVPKDAIDQRTGNKYSDSGYGSTIGNYYFYTEHEQAVCAENPSNQSIETSAGKAFTEASKNIIAL